MAEKKIKQRSKIKIEYEGKLEDGRIFDTTNRDGEQKPLEMEIGAGKVLPSFEKNVEGMKKGEEKEFTIKSKDAYGEPKKELQKQIPRKSLPQDKEPKEGMILMLGTPDGRQFPAKIVKVGKEEVTIDLNHPLAGHDLKFKVKIVDVK